MTPKPDKTQGTSTEDLIVEQLRSALETEGSDMEPCPSLDWVLLAEYLDNRLDGTTRLDLEAHLSACSSCRRLVMESALASQPDAAPQVPGTSSPQVPGTSGRPQDQMPNQVPGTFKPPHKNQVPGTFAAPDFSAPGPSTLRRRWPLALAAGLAALAAGLLWQAPTVAPPPSEPGVSPPGSATVASGSLGDALRGQLPPIAAFEEMLDLGRRPVLRHGSSRRAPQPLSPRWSLTSQVRPTFVWLAPPPSMTEPPTHPPGEVDLSEVLLVDSEETVVARIPALAMDGDGDGDGAGGVETVRWPASLPDLEPGQTYAWKINTSTGDGPVASDYVPFRVAPQPQQVSESQAWSGSQGVSDALAEAASLAMAGHLEAALERLRALQDPADRAAAEPLLGAIFEAQKLTPELASRQRQRLGWSSQLENEAGPPS